ncbi:MAG: hypothetical protein Q9167_005417 [Letrouitia subvulpina]
MLFGQSSTLLVFVLLRTLAVVHAIPLLERAAPINYKSCSSGEIALVNGHLDDMQEMARAAASHAYGTMRPIDEFLPHGGLLLHEFTHAWFASKCYRIDDEDFFPWLSHVLMESGLAADVKLREGANKNTVAYNHEYVLRLLREANGPTRTRNNAHTYAIFAAAVTFDKSNWSLDPNHLSADRDLK